MSVDDNGLDLQESSLLIRETPVVFQPTLAEIFGVTEAILLQQIHWFILNPHDKRTKLRRHQERQWVQFRPHSILNEMDGHLRFLSLRTFRRAISYLKERGVLLVDTDALNTINWYAIDHKALAAIEKRYREGDKSVCRNDTGVGKMAPGQNGTTTGAKKAPGVVPEVSNAGAKMARPHKDEIEDADKEIERFDLIFDVLESTQQDLVNEETTVRLGIIGRVGNAEGARRAMRRHILREWRDQGKI